MQGRPPSVAWVLLLATVVGARAQDAAPPPPPPPPPPVPSSSPEDGPPPPAPKDAPPPRVTAPPLSPDGEPDTDVGRRPGAPTDIPSSERPSVEQRLAALEAERQGDGALTRVVRAALERVELHGFVNALFVYGLERPDNVRDNAFPYRVNDADNLSFTVPYCKLGVTRELDGAGWDVGFGCFFGAGTMVDEVFGQDPDFNGGEEINLVEGWADIQVPTPAAPLSIRAGRVYGWFGVERLDLPDNPNLSLSYFAPFTPFTVSGASVGMDLVEGLNYRQWIVNGWDLVVDNNNGKSLGGQLAWTLGEGRPWLAFGWLAGPEQTDNSSNLRWDIELDLIWELLPTTEVRAALHYGQEEGAALDGGLAKTGGALLIFRQDLATFGDGAATLYAAGRVAYWRDQGGSRTGVDQALIDTTATLGLVVLQHGLIRIEYRRDWSSQDDVFLGRLGQPTSNHQDTLAIDFSVAF